MALELVDYRTDPGSLYEMVSTMEVGNCLGVRFQSTKTVEPQTISFRLAKLLEDPYEKDNEEVFKAVAEVLYSQPIKRVISIAPVSHMYRYITKTDVQLDDGSVTFFYLKKGYAREKMSEATGMILSNLFLGTSFNFVLDFPISALAMEGVKGDLFADLPRNYSFSDYSATRYGFALEFANAVVLDDRSDSNMILSSEGDVVHIDFETIFRGGQIDKGLLDSVGGRMPKNKKFVKKGREKAKEIIREKINDNWDLLEEIVEFIRSQEESSPVCNALDILRAYAAL